MNDITKKILLLYLTFVCFDTNAQPFILDKTLNGHNSEITHIAFRSEDNLLISGDKSGKLIIWNSETGEIINVLHEHENKITDISFSPIQNSFVSASYDGTLKIWNITNGQLLKTITCPSIGSYSIVNGNEPTFVTFDNSGNNIIYGGYNMQIVKTSINNNATQILQTVSGGGITSGCLSKNGKELVFGFLGNIVYLNLQNNIIVKQFKKSDDFSDFVCELEYLPNSNQLAYWAYNGKIHFINNQTYTIDYSINATTQNGTSNIAIAFDNSLLITGNDGNKTKIWDLTSKQIIQTLEGHTNNVTCFAVSSDNRIIVTASNDNKINIWKREQPNNEIITNNSVPEKIKDRNVDLQQTIQVQSNEVEILAWDKSQIDGDIISLNVNSNWVLENYTLTATKKSIKIKLNHGDNFLIMYAHNEGSISPNTAAISVKSGNTEQILSLKSTLNSCGTINIKFQ